jgi:N-methylhydantoinase A
VDDYSRGIVEGVLAMIQELQVTGDSIDEVVHGTTIATNAILENKGAKTALITTKGFRDVLELRRLRVPELFSLDYTPPPPLVERRLRLEVDERMAADGSVITELDIASVHRAIARIEEDGAEAVAICLLHSYRNAEHEERIAELVKEALPEAYLSVSINVLPEIREYERTSTTVVNAYIGPLVNRYIRALGRRLKDVGIGAPVRIMQSNGGVMSAAAAAETPAQIIESGPAAGVVGAHRLAGRLGLQNVITFDMGGTTAKASIIEDGERALTTEYEVGSGISLSSRLVKGRGHALKLPVIDIAEVGAGGGSIVSVDRGGALKVGPESAGASPGPACYGAGGTDATITDANVTLGFINPEELAGGAVRLHADLARQAIRDSAANPLGMSEEEAASGVFAIANVTMIRAIKAVSTYRGRDPRDFTMLAFGGSGPVHAAEIARSLGIRQVIVPPAPGVFSAVGLLEADPEYHFVQTFISAAPSIEPVAISKAYKALRERAAQALEADAISPADARWVRQADLRYSGQAYELTVDVPGDTSNNEDDDLDAQALAEVVSRFHHEHERTYGHMSEADAVDFVNLRYSARFATDTPPPQAVAGSRSNSPGERPVYFGPEAGCITTPIISRNGLSESPLAGPLIIEEYDATTVVPPGTSARLDAGANLIIDIELD